MLLRRKCHSRTSPLWTVHASHPPHRLRSADDGTYALKVIDRPADETAVALCREAALLASVNHPGLPRIHEVGTVDGRAYLVMDLVDGEPLSQLLRQSRLTPERVVAMAIDSLISSAVAPNFLAFLMWPLRQPWQRNPSDAAIAISSLVLRSILVDL